MNTSATLHNLATLLGETLANRGWQAATAESCTGGGVAQAITDVMGSSAWFQLGLVTYSDQMKTDLLGVSPALLKQHGAVSEPVVRAMVQGALTHSKADIAVAVSGIAGPGGAVEGKPVGMVCFAWGGSQNCESSTLYLKGDRRSVREHSIGYALERLIALGQSEVLYK